VSEEFGRYVLAWKDGNSTFPVPARYSFVAEENMKQTVFGKGSVSKMLWPCTWETHFSRSFRSRDQIKANDRYYILAEN